MATNRTRCSCTNRVSVDSVEMFSVPVSVQWYSSLLCLGETVSSDSFRYITVCPSNAYSGSPDFSRVLGVEMVLSVPVSVKRFGVGYLLFEDLAFRSLRGVTVKSTLSAGCGSDLSCVCCVEMIPSIPITVERNGVI